MKKLIGYVRCSTSHQVNEGVTIEAQENMIRQFAAAHGFEVVAIHTDAGLSGKRRDNRKGLEESLNQACKLRAALCVYSLSRLARSVKDAISIAEALRHAKSDLISLTEQIDTSTAQGVFVFNLFCSLAQLEAGITSERTTAALQFKKSKGERVGTLPYGFTEVDGKLEPLPEEQGVIEVVKQLRSQGLSLRKIAAALAERGIRNRAGNLQWTLNTLAKIAA